MRGLEVPSPGRTDHAARNRARSGPRRAGTGATSEGSTARLARPPVRVPLSIRSQPHEGADW
eukprot:6038733-Prymnesium_polylepis.1